MRRKLAGQKFNRWLVLSFAHSDGKHVMWNCICDCGTMRTVVAYDLTSGKSKSCGCFQREQASKDPVPTKTHGLSKRRVYSIWRLMIRRCDDPRMEHYSYYGGRGIKVCTSWYIFENFFADMKHPTTRKHTLDRIDNDKGYYKENCRWATRKEQRANQRQK